MTFLRHRCTSRRHIPLWVLLLGMRQPRVVHVTREHDQDVGTEDMGRRDRHRWTRSLRAPMVFRSLGRLFARTQSVSRVGSSA